jgi:hypothetical protein
MGIFLETTTIIIIEGKHLILQSLVVAINAGQVVMQ